MSEYDTFFSRFESGNMWNANISRTNEKIFKRVKPNMFTAEPPLSADSVYDVFNLDNGVETPSSKEKLSNIITYLNKKDINGVIPKLYKSPTDLTPITTDELKKAAKMTSGGKRKTRKYRKGRRSRKTKSCKKTRKHSKRRR